MTFDYVDFQALVNSSEASRGDGAMRFRVNLRGFQ